MKDWQLIRRERLDLTDFLLHLTRDSDDATLDAKDCLKKIIKDRIIRPSFAAMPNRYSAGKTRPTIKGPWPAVCLTEQPLWALVKMEQLSLWNKRYSGYGVAYYKPALHSYGARPVIYGDESVLGKLAPPSHPNYQKDKEVYVDGLKPFHQYLWSRYLPRSISDETAPIDFTWEREWRYPVFTPAKGLEFPIGLNCRLCAVIVRYDAEVKGFRELLADLSKKSPRIKLIKQRVVSLETAERKLSKGQLDYGRLDTRPEFEGQFAPVPRVRIGKPRKD